MIGIPRPLRVLLVGGAAVALVTTGVTAIVATPAAAQSPSTVRIEKVYPTDSSAAAGTCTIFRVVPLTDRGEPATDTRTVRIDLNESPSSSASQDVDFCVPPAAPDGQSGSRVDHAYYNGGLANPNPENPSTTPNKEKYCAGRSITPPKAGPTCGGSTALSDEPDVAHNAGPSDPFNVDVNTNPTGNDYVNDVTYNPNTRFVEFGVTALTPGDVSIDACIDGSGNGACGNDGDIEADAVVFKFSEGGNVQTTPAYNAVTLIAPDRPSYAAVQSPANPAKFELTLTNNSVDPVFGVTPNYRVDSGPNFSATLRTCGESDDFGVARCSYTGAQPGTDTITFWVNHSGASATGGPDAGEPTATVTVTTYSQPAPAASARFIDLTPNTPTSQAAGTTKQFVATVTDAGGTPVQGAAVTFEETGPGQFVGGTSPDGLSSTITINSGPDGRAVASIVVQAGEKGSDVITAKISPTATQCAQNFNGQTGTCQDSTTNTVSGGASASPSPTSTSTKSATPTTSSSPGSGALSLTLDSPSTITPGTQSKMTARGTPNSAVILRCYSRTPENADQQSPPYFDARAASLGSSGATQFVLNPGTNTRCFVKYNGSSDTDARNSPSIVQNVATALSLSAYRDGVRKYHFQGTNLPRRAGQLITLYRYATGPNLDQYCVPFQESYTPSSSGTCQAIRTATAFTNSSNVWRIDRTFTGSGQFYFVARTSKTLTNAAGFSNQRLTIIH